MSGRRLYALVAGAACHLAFAAAVLAMMVAMARGMTPGIGLCLGRVPQPWAAVADAALLLQFPLLHSWLLTRRGGDALGRLGPGGLGKPLATTTYALIASLEVLALFGLWTPSGVVWARVEGPAKLAIYAADACGWLLLLKAISDAGLALQTGALGWRAVWREEAPRFPPMPERGLFRHVRQPIYLAFAITTWATPVWTPDQLAVATTLTAYCLLGPLLKEARFRRRHGARFEAYRAAVPYWAPRLRRPAPR